MIKRAGAVAAALFGLAGVAAAPAAIDARAATCPSSPLASRCELWASTYGLAQYGETGVTAPLQIISSPTSNLVYETAAVSDTYQSYATVAYDKATGKVAWSALFSGPLGGDAEPFGLAVSPDGNRLFVTGRDDWIATSSDLGTVAYNAHTGQQLWSNTLSLGGLAAGESIKVSSDGSRVYVGGAAFSDNTATNYGFITLAYAATTGQKLWRGRYIGAAHMSDGIDALTVDPGTDRVFVTGHSVGTGGGDDIATVAYAGATGQQLWAARWSGGANSESIPEAIGVTPDGSTVFVTGYSNEGDPSSTDFVTIALNAASGARRWVAHYIGKYSGFATATALAVSPDSSSVYVVGQVPGRLTAWSVNGCDCRFGIVAYNSATGKRRWTALYGLDYVYTTGMVNQGATGAALSPDGASLYVTGPAYNGGISDVAATLSYNTTTGAQNWVARYTPAVSPLDGAVPTAVVTATSGRVFVAALSEHWITDTQNVPSGTYYKYGVIAYAR